MKDKKRAEDEVESTDEFYYEIIGIFATLMAIIVFSELGAVGFFLRIFLKVFFGDWYFIIVIFLLCYGIYITWKRRFVNYKSRRFIGFYLFLVCVLTLSHFPIYYFLLKYTDNTVTGTWALFVEYLKNYDDSLLMGGGIIGAIGFFMFSFLLGEIGVILICIILILVSIAFMLEKTISELLLGTKSSTQGIFSRLRSIKRFIKQPIVQKPVKPKNKRLSIHILKDIPKNKDIQLQNNVAIEYTKHIRNILKYNRIGAEISNVTVGNSYTKFELRLFSKIDIESLRSMFLEEGVFVSLNGTMLTIELVNKFINQISLKELMNYSRFIKNKEVIPIGFDIDGERLELDISKSTCTMLHSLPGAVVLTYFMLLLFKYNADEYEISGIDLDFLAPYFSNIKSHFTIESMELEIAKNNTEKMHFYIINRDSIDDEFLLNIIRSVKKTTHSHIVIIDNLQEELDVSLIKNFDLILFGKTCIDISMKNVNSDLLCKISESEIVALNRGFLKRISKNIISDTEIKKISKKQI